MSRAITTPLELSSEVINGAKSEAYMKMFDQKTTDNESRKKLYYDIAKFYYDLVTDFFEFGWGESFHFAPRFIGETFEMSIARHEHQLVSKMGVKAGQKILDVGCGVGGPARSIARFSGAHIVGLNINDYQIKKGEKHGAYYKLDYLVSYKKGDFLHIPFADNTFDGVYEIEATCHAPDKVPVYEEIFRVLKPGQMFGQYEWIMTDKYDPSNSAHRDIKFGIEIGDGLPDIPSAQVVLDALKKVGFEIIEYADLALTSQVPWYLPLQGSYTVSGFRASPMGRYLTQKFVWALETVRVAPTGSTQVQQFLETAAQNLVKGGETGIFSPMFYTLARKPLAPVTESL
mmetsp:Transcript_21927/g.36324  ORF Transcript_21927/g.36324 Transcript_21927/m.36324 type:complete len:344 (+) Transcript_21927:131-1162(+)|eukprot:CAMPEP_0184643430 /NCGR_PEP_ID=MMETSP0308-20130426/270_1 /TAXON_ID=38269 /ORGANISM="Gloeochaete witrockiana, Strain SAG 46.84" /LENGTH=343 /DNA_ID=CAMNT_0027071363 /DNA_START=131 /DNA_END=1162 /DNA_ORIENTATION=-